jgi:hypothetical protein
MTKLQLPVGVITRLRELWGHKEVPNTDPILASRDRKFQNHAPTALTEKSVYQLVKTAFERHVGIPSITPRTLRAYFVRTYAKERQSPPTLPTPYSTESFSEPSDPHLRCNLTDLWFPDEGY